MYVMKSTIKLLLKRSLKRNGCTLCIYSFNVNTYFKMVNMGGSYCEAHSNLHSALHVSTSLHNKWGRSHIESSQAVLSGWLPWRSDWLFNTDMIVFRRPSGTPLPLRNKAASSESDHLRDAINCAAPAGLWHGDAFERTWTRPGKRCVMPL